MPDASILIASRDFRDVIAIASRVLEARSTIPILSMLHCRANGSFEVSGTDLDIMLTAKVEHGGGPKREFILPQALSVSKAVNAGGDQTVSITSADGKVGITSGALALKVGNSLPADDFPGDAAAMAAETFTASLSHEQLRALSRVAGAVSTEETRYYLNGVYLHHVEGTTYRAVATDGHRLCFYDLELPDAAGSLAGIILPRKTIRLLLGMAGKPAASDSGIGLAVGTTNKPNRETSTAPEKTGSPTRARVSLRVGNVAVSVATKLIDGTFPDYKRVVPTDPGKSFLFQAAELRRAVEAVSAGSGRARAVKIVFDTEGAKIDSHFVDTGIDSTFRVACDHKHAGFEVGFNGEYLLNMIEAAGPGEFVINTSDAAAPALIKNPADTAWTGILMPMRV
ncbi:DNA polymerase III subunit beta [Sphingomonas nostoxanthinifaciens]|uniref:DNA polymerase III subunit beta n=1 Tax=Sphingomonas nostoxanthinifaciens TaxID=2872652 RepID=UPI001CC1C3FC|nr:DNA polymerase III subunit beta [Sphingomonas nostoxanthinifaciens]UAK23649.1 DNA polymerase III subunit beta [Sphingomonas nostoxanthinifaciens]